MPESPLSPGFLVLHGNHPEALRDLVIAWLARQPLAPLEDECMLVQSNGVAQWLKLALAQPVAQGGHGIAAALRMVLPARFQWQVYRSVLQAVEGAGAVPAESPFDKPLLLWRLLRLLPGLLADPVFQPLAQFLAQDADGRKRFQLAERLADLLDQYQVYRADWLADWSAGRDQVRLSRGGTQPLDPLQRWQPALWRALLADVGAATLAGLTPPGSAEGSRAQVHQRFLAALASLPPGQRVRGLPRRVVVFGISSMPQQALEVLAALAGHSQVLVAVHNPCEHDWSAIVADQDLLRAERRRRPLRPGSVASLPVELTHTQAHPLLAAWGKQGRDFIRLLDAHDAHEAYAPRFAAVGARTDCFDANPADTLLRQLQDDIRDLRPLAESRARWPAVDAAQDHSLRFHSAHSPQREVEALHDALLHRLAADPSLRARDILVMVPDIATYAAPVQAVFGLLPADDPRHIPYTLADRGPSQTEPVLQALAQLLGLPQARLGARELLGLLDVPAIRRRFGLAEDDLPLLQRWASTAAIRAGLHAVQQAALGLPTDHSGAGANTWERGLERLLLGFAAGDEPDGPAAEPGAVPWPDLAAVGAAGGLQGALLGPLVQLLHTLARHWQALGQPGTPVQWGQRLHALLSDLFAPADEREAATLGAAEGRAVQREGLLLLRLGETLDTWLAACAQAALTEPLPLTVVREHWLASLDSAGLAQPFIGGGVTFATLMPMRAIPFRVVALLGMNDGDYPRSRPPLDFDLMGQDWRPGDRSRREDDRYLFLEAVLSARDHLHISWVGRAIQDDRERPPSVLVAQLRDHVAAGWRLAGTGSGEGADTDTGTETDTAGAPPARCEALLAALTVQHRLQPFHPDHFSQAPTADPRLRSFAHEWRASWLPTMAQATSEASAQPTAPAGSPLAGAALPPWLPEGPLSLRSLADFLKDPPKAFLRQRLGVVLDQDDELSAEHEPFALDGLQHWQVQNSLIEAQRAALDEGRPREAALAQALDRLRRQAVLPPGAFGARAQAELAEPMDALFTTWARLLQAWPERLPDELLHLPGPAGPHAQALTLDDSLDALRGNGQGRRVRLVLDSGSFLQQVSGASANTRQRRWRREALARHWVAHLAAEVQRHRGAAEDEASAADDPAGLVTIALSKHGMAVFRPLGVAEARSAWQALLSAYQAGMARPLPFLPKLAGPWHDACQKLLADGDGDGDGDGRGDGGGDVNDNGNGNGNGHTGAPGTPPWQQLTQRYEGDEAGRATPERVRNPSAARAFPTAEALWGGGEFATLTQALLWPMDAARCTDTLKQRLSGLADDPDAPPARAAARSAS